MDGGERLGRGRCVEKGGRVGSLVLHDLLLLLLLFLPHLYSSHFFFPSWFALFFLLFLLSSAAKIIILLSLFLSLYNNKGICAEEG